jgi:fibronectin-binding autotransporter adhesin
MKSLIPIRLSTLRHACLLAVIASFLGLGQIARANTENDVKNDGSSDLTASATYVNGGPATTDDVTFTLATYTNTAFTDGSSITIGTLNDLASNALTITGSTGAVLTLNGGTNTVAPSSSDLLYAKSSNLTISGTGSVNVAAAGNIDVGGSTTTSIAESLTGTSAITLTGTGTLNLAATSNSGFSGGIIVANGNLTDSNNTDLGTGSLTLGSSVATSNAINIRLNSAGGAYSNAIVVNAGTSASVARSLSSTNGNGIVFSGTQTLNNGATITYASGGGAVNVSGNISGTGNVNFGSIGATRTGTITLSGGVNNAGTITNDSTFKPTGNYSGGNNVISGVIGSNVTGITQNVAGLSLTLSGVNTNYAGVTNILNGTLATSGSGTLGQSNINVADTTGAIFTLTNPNAIGATGLLSFGNNSVINLNFTGNDSLAGITDTTTNMSLAAGTYTVNQLNTFFGDTAFATTDNPTMGTTFTVTAPEPSTWALMLGGLGLLIGRMRWQTLRNKSQIS